MEKIESKENYIRIVKQYQNLVFSICLEITKDYFASEDITQETFLAAYRKYDTFDGANEKAWISRIAANASIDYLRKQKHSISMPEEELPETMDSSNDPSKLYAAKDVLMTARKACEALPEPYDDIALAHFIEGRSAKEIALQSGKNIKTVETQIYRARSMLRKTIRKEDLQT